MKNIFLLLFIGNILLLNAQTKSKSFQALRISETPTIDGNLNESFWQNTENAQDFVMFKPGDGTPERPTKKTIVKVAYNDEAIFFGAIMFDDEVSKIPMQFGGRDQFGNVDFFLISINPNNDGQNDTEFIVMSTGAQGDAKVSGERDDFSWNAVWDSQVSVNEKSWIVEIKIPYSALRFSNSEIQTWGINFHRKINYLNEQYSWNYIDKKIGAPTQYSGKLTGITNIEPPTRLSFSPYASVLQSSYDGDSQFDYNFGMDLKYGINESFTLDATLIPDFGQTAFDEQVLNLGPFEQRYQEKRSFFTEGTELFSKGNLFYSRRIGNAPVGYDTAEESLSINEEIIDNPFKVNMLNALKLSGRTDSGLGIGVFNAITEKTEARILNTATNEIRKMVTEPLANYNVLVLDQQFNKNSSVSLVNTNVLRSGNFRDANVSALVFDVLDKKSKYNVKGNFKLSNVNENSTTKTGYATFFEFAKVHGNFQYELNHSRSNDTYEVNDLGFQNQNNYANYSAEVSYRIFEPIEHFNDYKIKLSTSRKYQNEPNNFTEHRIELESFFVKKSRLAFGGGFETFIGNRYDYYEPRVEDRFFKQTGYLALFSFLSTDYRKKFAIDIRPVVAIRYHSQNRFIELKISPRYRFSDKFQIVHSLLYSKVWNENGYVNNLDNGSIIFGIRDAKTVSNSISGKLNFNTKSSLNLAFRHFWSPVIYESDFYELNSKGTLDNSSYTSNHDINYNIWNLDLSYSWEFAPGSQLVALYRSSIFNEDTQSNLNFNDNLHNLFKEPETTIFSLKFIYYLDYNKLKTWI
ncbi:DUF5916 domain-containing protein [Lutibacter sp.]|uniref:DUF5916 domain-containing protein n=1 Tax=Lutibacter sp. TaxID=1925666 RepID=UPI00273593D6|nr:DUF5916 domain-containing protein [Lutibacter sp.]MDP3313538.1 DUF5916 domain-containing protein [Lutibacter sp.]